MPHRRGGGLRVGPEALERGRALARFEQAIGFAPEAALHAWAFAHPLVLDAAWVVHLFCHLRPWAARSSGSTSSGRPPTWRLAGRLGRRVARAVAVGPPSRADTSCSRLVAGGIVARLAGPRWIRVSALAYPVLMTVVTLLTFNHFWVDAVASVAVTAAAAGAVALARRRFPDAVRDRLVVRNAS